MGILGCMVSYGASCWLVMGDEGVYLHRGRGGVIEWRNGISPYRVMLYGTRSGAERAVSRYGGSVGKATYSIMPLPECLPAFPSGVPKCDNEASTRRCERKPGNRLSD